MKRALALLATTVALLALAAPAASAVPVCPASTCHLRCGVFPPVGPWRAIACTIA